METPKPRISVVIPTCHRNDLLAKCLECLAPGIQTLSADQYEVIVTDDGSQSTAEQTVAEKYPWAYWTQGPRRGPAANRNHGAGLAIAEWIAFTDDDCLPDPGWLRAFADSIEDGIQVFEGKTVCRDWPNSPLFDAPINETGGYLWSCNFMIACSLFEGLNGFDERFPYAAMEDVDLRERIKSQGPEISFVDNALIDHPARPRSQRKQRLRARESNVMYSVKWKRSATAWSSFEAYFFRRFGSQTLRGPYRLQAFKCLLSIYVDFFITIARIGTWRRSAQEKFGHE